MKTFLKKHVKLFIALVIVGALLITAIIGLLKVRASNNKAYVQPVEMLNNTWAISSSSESGTITDGATQNVVVSTLDIISEVYVQEGDYVAKGDKLFSYDTEQLELNVESAKLDLDSAKADYITAQNRLNRYVNMDSLSEAEAKQVEEYIKNTETNNYNAYISAMNTAKEQAKKTWDAAQQSGLAEKQTKAKEEYDKAYEEAYKAALEAAKKKSQEAGNQWSDADEAGFKTGFDSNYPAYVAPEVEPFDEVTFELEYEAAHPYKSVEYPDLTEYDANYYTDEQKAQMVADQQVATKRAEAEVRSAEIRLEEAENKVKDASVRATMDGVVTKIGNPEDLPKDGSAFAIITSTSGVAVTGAVSEFRLGEVQVGDRVSVYSYMTGASSEAEITSISPYPDTSGQFWNSGNQAASLYPYTAILDSPEGFNSGDGVEITPIVTETSDDRIVLESVYVRGDLDGSYVMIDDGTGHLKKQRVTTRMIKTQWGDSYTEVLTGLNSTDMIAFPYGSTAGEGNVTTDQYSYGLFDMFGF